MSNIYSKVPGYTKNTLRKVYATQRRYSYVGKKCSKTVFFQRTSTVNVYLPSARKYQHFHKRNTRDKANRSFITRTQSGDCNIFFHLLISN